MRPQLAARAAVQGGLVTRSQAVEAGYSERELHTLTRVGGPWVIVRRGVYAERELWDSVDPYDGQMALRDRAAHLSMRTVHVLSHDSAARALGLGMLRPKLQLTHVTRPDVVGSRTEHGVKHHLAKTVPEDLRRVDGIPITGPARTALDIGREHGFAAGLVACDSAMRAGVSAAEFGKGLLIMRCWPGITAARKASELADPGAETVGESMARILVMELGLGVPETQFPVRIATGVAWCDLRVGCHLFEFDGRIKYLRRDQGGVANRSAEEVVWEERRRQGLVCSEGLGMSRIIWEDFWGAARRKALERLRMEYAVTLARFGDVLPEHLERFAREMRGRRSA
jgi:hypothetical protein